MKEKPKLFLFFYQILCIFIFSFLLSGCGLPNDSIESIDRNIEEIKEAVKDDGVQIIIKDVDYSEMPIEEILNILRLSERGFSIDDKPEDYGITNPEDAFSSGSDKSIKDIMQDYVRELTEMSENPDIKEEDKLFILDLLEDVNERLDEIEGSSP